MDNQIVQPNLRDVVMGLVLLVLVLAAFAFVGTIDHDQEVAHEQWMARMEGEGTWILR